MSLSLVRSFRHPPSVDGLSERQTAKNGTDPGYVRERAEERKKRSAERTPFTAQWAPLKPKVMKVSGCLSRFLSRGPDSQPDHPLRHAQGIPIYRVCTSKRSPSFPVHRRSRLASVDQRRVNFAHG